MASPDTPLTRERIVDAAEDVIRRFGSAKATVTDVAKVLGVSHAAVYRHVATKAELRDLVVRLLCICYAPCSIGSRQDVLRGDDRSNRINGAYSLCLSPSY